MNTNDTIDFSIEAVNIGTVKADNSDVQSGCWGDTGSGAYC